MKTGASTQISSTCKYAIHVNARAPASANSRYPSELALPDPTSSSHNSTTINTARYVARMYKCRGRLDPFCTKRTAIGFVGPSRNNQRKNGGIWAIVPLRGSPGSTSPARPPTLPGVPPKYDLLAIDLDGTLLDAKGRVSDANLMAIHAARAAGIRTIICTGRGLAECRHITSAISQTDPVVVAGGSIIADPVFGHTLKRFPVRLPLVHDTVQRLNAMGHAALVLKDPSQTGYDYLVIHGPNQIPLDPVTTWWFQTMSIKVRFLQDIDHDEHPEHTVRVGACGLSDSLALLKSDLLLAAAGQAHVHSFPAVVAPEHASRVSEGRSLHILELFDADATKWSAISHLAFQWGIPPSRIAAIGDEVNDESMIRHAGLSIAMGNAVPLIRDIAQRHTLHHHQDGVAFAIDHLLRGLW